MNEKAEIDRYTLIVLGGVTRVGGTSISFEFRKSRRSGGDSFRRDSRTNALPSSNALPSDRREIALP